MARKKSSGEKGPSATQVMEMQKSQPLVEPKPVPPVVVKENMVRWIPRDLLTGCPRVQINEREYHVTALVHERWLILTYLGEDKVPVCHKLRVHPKGFVSECTCPSYRVATGCKHTKAMSRALKSNLSPIKFPTEG